ncbi:hypothetical protein [Kocuria coralli]|uniref:hypothetical protein n=1 Tax=Kocuria coralli TaxID=1461025 RepID=UPI0015F2C0FA|nr:hypothetical protein [Kocuria coralli]
MTGLDAAGVDSVVHQENGWKTRVVINAGHRAHPDDETTVTPPECSEAQPLQPGRGPLR